MKLRNKLIPILTVASLITASTPLIANCSSNGDPNVPESKITGKCTFIYENETKKFQPSITPLGGSYETDKITEVYFNKIRQHPNWLAEEIMEYKYGSSLLANKLTNANDYIALTIETTSYKENGVWRVNVVEKKECEFTTSFVGNKTEKYVVNNVITKSAYKVSINYENGGWYLKSNSTLSEAKSDSTWLIKSELPTFHHYVDGVEQEITEQEKNMFIYSYDSTNITQSNLNYAKFENKSYFLSKTEKITSTVNVPLQKYIEGNYSTNPTQPYNISSGNIYNYTGAICRTAAGTDPKLIGVSTIPNGEMKTVSVKSVKVNGIVCERETAAGIIFYLPDGLEQGSSLKIEVEYTANANQCVTAISIT